MMLLVVNSGSSSLKLALFDPDLREVAQARLTEIGSSGVATHAEALVQGLQQAGVSITTLTGAAHRVVHGGAALTAPCRITPAVVAAIEACVPLAPLHNPANLTGIQALAEMAPQLAQYVSFDTAFHATNPEVARRYALPDAGLDQGIRRYGFHGISYASLVRKLQENTGKPVPKRLLALHLGNGASLAAIHNGQSVATTMGYSPLDGLTMGTRTGNIDGNAVLRLAELYGIDGAARILNRESGLLALGGSNDMRALHAAHTPQARFAIEHFCYWAVRHAGSMIAAMGGLDAVAFTGGIGENDPLVRAKILDGLGWAGVDYDSAANRQGAQILHNNHAPVAIWTVAAEEERQIAQEAYGIMTAEAAQ